MKFSQAIAKLEENQKLKFKDQYGIIASLNEDGYLVLERNGNTKSLGLLLKVASSQRLPADNWGLIQEPVDFMTAYKAWQDGKTIRLQTRDGEFKFAKGIKDFYVSMSDIEYGRWFIED